MGDAHMEKGQAIMRSGACDKPLPPGPMPYSTGTASAICSASLISSAFATRSLMVMER